MTLINPPAIEISLPAQTNKTRAMVYPVKKMLSKITALPI
jgi:hypothetical protein